MNITPGLIDKNTEIFVVDDKLKCTHNGSIVDFYKLPEDILQAIELDMIKNKAFKYASELAESSDYINILTQYAKCNFGGFNNTPDVTQDGKLTHEYFECGKRLECPYEGKLCQHVKVQNGFLTPREIVYLKLVGKSKLDKEIATEMNISEETISSYKRKIQEKTGLKTKTDIAVFAFQLGL